jgi:hypothetical protein
LIGIEVWLPLGMIPLVGDVVPISSPWIAFRHCLERTEGRGVSG